MPEVQGFVSGTQGYSDSATSFFLCQYYKVLSHSYKFFMPPNQDDQGHIVFGILILFGRNVHIDKTVLCVYCLMVKAIVKDSISTIVICLSRQLLLQKEF